MQSLIYFKKLFIAICCVLCICIAPISCDFALNVFAEEEFKIDAKSGLLVDFSSGEILFEQNADARLPVASMVKLMTIFLTIEEIEKGNLNLDDCLNTSANASSMGGSQVFIDANSKYKIEDMLKSVIMASANDASVALSEHISGSEKQFVKKMNARAKELGMNNTLYANSTGLPAPMQYSTAKDCAIILKNLVNNEIYKKFSTIWMDELVHPSGRKTELVNTNKLIRYYKGCDCGKTGSTDEAGYCLSASAKKDDMRLIAVVMGAKTAKERFNQTVLLFNFGFSNFSNQQIIDMNEKLGEIDVKKSKISTTGVFAQENYYALVKKGAESQFETQIEIDKNITAPKEKGSVVGKLTILKNGEKIKEIPLVINEEIKSITFKEGFKKIIEKF